MPGEKREPPEYRQVYHEVLSGHIYRALRVGAAHPRKVARAIAANPFLVMTGIGGYIAHRRAALRRRRCEREGLVVPPLLLIGVTARCNLACAGCYMRGRNDTAGPEMTGEELGSVISQAADLGVTHITFLGGEPLLRWKELSSIARANPHVLFPLFTNGLLIDEQRAAEMARCPNIIPFISFEGFREETDARRGRGVYDRLLTICGILDKHLPFFGCSVTVTRENMATVLGGPFIRSLVGTGAGAVAYIQYVPTEPGTEEMVVTPDQRQTLNGSIDVLSRKYPALFMVAPGDVERYGGCLAGGRGFLYVSPAGDLEPCAMTPCSDANLRTVPLKEALRSPFLAAIRRNHRMLKPYGRCPLRTNEAWVRDLYSRGRNS